MAACLSLSPVYKRRRRCQELYYAGQCKPSSCASESGVKGGPAKRDVYRRPLTPHEARQNCQRTKRELRLTQDSFTGLDQGSFPRILR